MKFLLPIVTTVLFLTSCLDDERVAHTDTIEYFSQHIRADMSYKVMVRTFGEPDGDVGSGIHIYVYTLEDFTEIRIGYTDRILYANHVDSNNQLLATLI